MEYSFKDVLSGMRYQYLIMRKKLDNLQKEIKILDGEITKCLVLLGSDNNIACYFYNKKHFIDAIINISKDLGLPLFKLENLEMDKDMKTIYHFQNDLQHYHIIIENLEKFKRLMIDILNDNFTFMMRSLSIDKSLDDKKYNLKIDYNYLGQEQEDLSLGITGINYYPKDDFIKLDYLGTLKSDELEYNLNIKYNKKLFNWYQQDSIENHHKEIVLYSDSTNTHEFKIEEEERRLVLVKR